MSDFSLSLSLLSDSPPAPSRPTVVKVQSDSITISWNEAECTGNHNLRSFTIQYFETDSNPFFLFFGSFMYIRNIDSTRRNYTISNLDPVTSNSFRVQAVSVDGRASSYSPTAEVFTLPPGMISGLIHNSKYLNTILINYMHQFRSIDCVCD